MFKTDIKKIDNKKIDNDFTLKNFNNP